jgi:hypothetical protein
MPRATPCSFIIALLALFLSAAVAAQATSQVTTSVTVAGNVAQSLTLTVADLKRLPSRAIEYAPPPGAEHKSSGEPVRHYTGCLLRDVLAAAKPVENKPRELRRSLCAGDRE